MNRQSEYKVQRLESDASGVWCTVDMYDSEDDAVAKASAAARADSESRFRVITSDLRNGNVSLHWDSNVESKAFDASKKSRPADILRTPAKIGKHN